MDLAQLAEICAEMRRLGVTEWNGVKLGPEPVAPAPPPVIDDADVKDDSEARRRDRLEYYENLLYSSGGDPAEFVAREEALIAKMAAREGMQ